MATPKNDDDIITDIIEEEGAGASNVAGDAGGLTYKGLSSRSNPDLFAHGIPTDAQVRQRYEDRYITQPGWGKIKDFRLKSLLVDWSVNSGSFLVIQELQKILGVKSDGVFGSDTQAALDKLHPEDVVIALVIARLKMLGRIVQRNPSQAKFILGWIERTCEFLV